LHGVRDYDMGWLYAGKADLIAFEKNKSFILVKRLDLIDLVQRVVDFESFVSDSKAAHYKIYQRSGRPDKITLIETILLDQIKCDEWEKIVDNDN